MIGKAIKDLVGSRDLGPDVVEEVAGQIMSGQVADIQAAAFLIALRMKGETAEEIAAFAGVMRENCVCIKPHVTGTLVDTCGTGGDSTGTFNISTAAAFIIAGCGIPVAKHGNRSVSSKCGSADILESVGVNIDLEPGEVQSIIEKAGIGFMFAPRFHPAMKNIQGVRNDLGIRTVFNILGPLTNPANADAQVIGVYSPEVAMKVATALKFLGAKRAMVVHGNGMDELTTTGLNRVVELDNNIISKFEFDSTEFGIGNTCIGELVADNIETSKSYFMEVMEGKEGPRQDIAVLNAAAGIVVSGKVGSISEGIEAARDSVASGNAMEKLERLREEASRYEA